MPTAIDHLATSDVSAALSLLVETLEKERERLNSEGAKAMQVGEYGTAQAVINFAERLLAFQDEARALAENWKELEELRDAASPEVQQIVGVRIIPRKHTINLPRIKSGNYKKLPLPDLYWFHILEALDVKGGRGLCQDVSTAVNTRIKMNYPQFRMARTMMASKGWITQNDSNRFLQISESGRKWLNRQQQKYNPTENLGTNKFTIVSVSNPQAKASTKSTTSVEPFEFSVPLEAKAVPQKRTKDAQSDGLSHSHSDSGNVPDDFRIGHGKVVKSGDWVEHESLGFGKILRINSALVYTPHTDSHEVWFSNGKRDVIIKNQQLRIAAVRLVPVSGIPEAILRRAPSAK